MVDKKKSVLIEKLKPNNNLIEYWFLDAPKNNLVLYESNWLEISGWVLPVLNSNPDWHVYIKDDSGKKEFFKIEVNRPDVYHKVLGKEKEECKDAKCGFKFKLNFLKFIGNLKLGFSNFKSQEEVDVAIISFVNVISCIEGRSGWLFLDNDSNRSVDQYTGNLLLNNNDLASWAEYFKGVNSLVKGEDKKAAFLIAPSKEEVLRKYYPFERASITVLDQVLQLQKDGWNLINMADVFLNSFAPEACFKRNDTHWTDRGALLAVMCFLDKIGFNCDCVNDIFKNDIYELKKEFGDLGSKMTPPRSAETEYLQGLSVEEDVAFDNFLPNIGRVIIYSKKDALFQKNLLIFGSSSSYQMLRYLRRIFMRIVFVHSAANIDREIFCYEQPDILLIQSNSRFLIKPPVLNFSLKDAVNAKTSHFSYSLKERIKKYINENKFDRKDTFYSEISARAINC